MHPVVPPDPTVFARRILVVLAVVMTLVAAATALAWYASGHLLDGFTN